LLFKVFQQQATFCDEKTNPPNFHPQYNILLFNFTIALKILYMHFHGEEFINTSLAQENATPCLS
jgi:hypothetical protein